MKALKILVIVMAVFTANLAAAQGVFTFCKNVDDNVYPVEPVSEIASGEGVYFHFGMEKPIGKEGDENITVGWIIHTVGEDGKDNGFIQEYMTFFQPGYRRFCTGELMRFDTPGHYRVYAISWDDRQLNYHPGNFEKYYAKNEIIVK